MTKVFRCPTCKREHPYSKNIVMIMCPCGDEMIEFDSKWAKDEYKVEIQTEKGCKEEIQNGNKKF